MIVCTISSACFFCVHVCMVILGVARNIIDRKIHCLTREFHVKFHLKNRYRTHRFAMSAISVFQVKFNVEFTSQAVNFSWIALLQKGNSITGRKQTFCIFVSRAGQWTNDGNTFKVSCQDLANRKQDIFRLKTTFISTSWRKQCLTFYNFQQKTESTKYRVV